MKKRSPNSRFKDVETRVKARSKFLKQELGVRNAGLIQILIIIQFTWMGTAAEAGSSHIFFWLLGISLFLVPLAFVVTYLNRFIPLEGGIYQWSKLGFNDFIGYMVGWNYYLSNIIFLSIAGLEAANFISYAVGSNADGIAESKVVIIISNCILIGVLAIVSVLGFGFGKWLYDISGILRFALFFMLALAPLLIFAGGTPSDYHAFKLTLPAFSLTSLSLFSRVAFGAFGGFEEIATFAGECKDAPSTITNSIFFSAPVIALLYIFGTISIVTFVSPDKTDIIGPILQVFAISLGPFGVVKEIAIPVISVALLFLTAVANSFIFAQNARLPMVAGWDDMVAQWFTKLHDEYKTPVNSIIFSSLAALILGSIALIGIDSKEAFKLLLSISFTLWALTYLVMFALPLIGFRGMQTKAGLGLKIMSACGLTVTALFIIFSIFPVDVQDWAAFSIKALLTIVLVNAIGVFIFSRRKGRRK